MHITELDPEIRSELGTLPRTLAEVVGRHMVMAGRLLDEDPERAYEHAVFARRKASRIGVVREAAGIAAYTVGKWQEALSDLRAARRMTGRDNFLSVIADCERGLGRPERALDIARDPAADQLPIEDRIELRIVAAGARRDLGQPQAALVELQVPELKERRARPWVARLFYAYADALLEVGREEEAREFFARASAVDREGVTDADERLAALEGVEIVDIGDDVVWTDAEDPYVEDEDEGEDDFARSEAEPQAAARTPVDRPEADGAAGVEARGGSEAAEAEDEETTPDASASEPVGSPAVAPSAESAPASVPEADTEPSVERPAAPAADASAEEPEATTVPEADDAPTGPEVPAAPVGETEAAEGAEAAEATDEADDAKVEDTETQDSEVEDADKGGAGRPASGASGATADSGTGPAAPAPEPRSQSRFETPDLGEGSVDEEQ
ncbi:hypothetical protein LG943_26340 [Streptomonospora sp. S1-112]|uniref:Tetratricopeptide repeat protein n=1 Tax=Streptomonospora mangrovi TaxID=2883123 RepID=A0A9X3NVT0_9ACTN|nr:hypothetical protein [Streptomonospora mangrovi]MDA0567815.1 hypothetical protein [Streptomonospora mangrovi]